MSNIIHLPQKNYVQMFACSWDDSVISTTGNTLRGSVERTVASHCTFIPIKISLQCFSKLSRNMVSHIFNRTWNMQCPSVCSGVNCSHQASWLANPNRQISSVKKGNERKTYLCSRNRNFGAAPDVSACLVASQKSTIQQARFMQIFSDHYPEHCHFPTDFLDWKIPKL